MAKLGLDFTQTENAVTHSGGNAPATEINVIYPGATASNGIAYGVTTSFNWDSRNRETYGNDARLAGVWFPDASGRQAKLTLPDGAGEYDVWLAAGDAAAATTASWLVKDGATTLLTLSGSPGANEFIDASNTLRTAAAWPGANAPARMTFAGTVLTLEAGSASARIAHIALQKVVAVTPTLSTATATATGPTTATIGITTDTLPSTTAISYLLLPAADAQPTAATIVSTATGTITTGAINTALTVSRTGLTINVPLKAHFAQGASSNVQSTASFMPSTLTYSGTVASQAGAINAAFSFSGANISTLFSGGNGSKTFSLASGTLPAGMTINSSTGNPQGTPTASGVFSGISVTCTDSSTVPGAQTSTTNTFTITVSPAAALAATLDAIASDFQFIQQNALAISLTLDPATSGLAFTIQPGVLDIEPLANGSTSLWAGRNDVSLRVYHDTTGALLYLADPVSSDGVGQLAQVSSTAIQAGQWVIVVVRIPTSPVALGVWRYLVT